MRRALTYPMHFAYTQDMVTGAELRAARKKLGESQATFGARIGVDQSTIHRWEKFGVPTVGAARVAAESLLATALPRMKGETEIHSAQAE